MKCIRKPEDVRETIMAALVARKQSRYGFVRACSDKFDIRPHTVDCVLADPKSSSHTIPTLRTAIDLLHAAGYDLVVKKRDGGIEITTPRRGAK